jgi:hypothetical protein
MANLHHLIFSKFEKLNGKNYSSWSHKILNISEFGDLDQIILGKEQRPNNDFEDYDKRHKHALLLLKLSLTNILVPEVRNSIVASVIWTNIKNKY